MPLPHLTTGPVRLADDAPVHLSPALGVFDDFVSDMIAALKGAKNSIRPRFKRSKGTRSHKKLTVKVRRPT